MIFMNLTCVIFKIKCQQIGHKGLPWWMSHFSLYIKTKGSILPIATTYIVPRECAPNYTMHMVSLVSIRTRRLGPKKHAPLQCNLKHLLKSRYFNHGKLNHTKCLHLSSIICYTLNFELEIQRQMN